LISNTKELLFNWLQSQIQKAAERRWLLPACALLAAAGTLTAAFPVTAIVVPAVLLVPLRWRGVAFTCALGSTLGALALIEIVHSFGWSQLEVWFPQLTSHANWQNVQNWIDEYGVLSLFLIAASPLPQTPALILFGIAGDHFLSVFIAVFAGKMLKYSIFAWLTSHFPDRFLRIKKDGTP
jgi:membrane protein YqaA with SNARE-associated domain